MDLPEKLRDELAEFQAELVNPHPKLSTSLAQVAYEFFDEHKNDGDPGLAPDSFFGYVAGIWLDLIQRGLEEKAEELWMTFVNLAKEWDAQHPNSRPLHKGAAYYWWGGTAVRRGNIRKGFFLFHLALEEDKRKHPSNSDPDSPAYKFVTLDKDSVHQFFHGTVKRAGDRVESALEEYRRIASSSFSYADFQNRFLRHPNLREPVFVFSLATFEVMNLEDIFRDIGPTGEEFSSQLCANSLFDLCQVVEETIRYKSGAKGEFFDQAKALCNKKGWLKPEDALSGINQKQQSNFDVCIKDLLRNVLVTNRLPGCIPERDLWLTYALRNSGAHNLASKRVIREHFDNLYQAVMNTLFATVENLYP